MRSSVEIYSLATGSSRVVLQTDRLIEAPNYSRDGQFLIVNGGGLLYRIPVSGGELERIDTGFAVTCNNDHGLSPDGGLLAITDKTEFGKAAIYVLPVEGGTPRLVTRNLPSYWHGWSPDGSTMAYCGIRNDVFDIYTISPDGGEERRMTKRGGPQRRSGLVGRWFLDIFQFEPHRAHANLSGPPGRIGCHSDHRQPLRGLVSAPFARRQACAGSVI